MLASRLLGVGVACVFLVACSGASDNGGREPAGASEAAPSSAPTVRSPFELHSGQPAKAAQKAAALRFAHCMRRYGVHEFPDPDASGRLSQPADSVRALPRFARAQRACAKYADETEPAEMSPAGRVQAADAMLAFVRCMRTQGVNLSDPIIGANSMVLRLPTGLSPDDAVVERANKKCAAAQARVLTVIGRFPGDPGTAAFDH